jgi:peptidoglycan/LPS O-acetylase OafA/YrhL
MAQFDLQSHKYQNKLLPGNKLPGLNGLRAIAASLVLIAHVYQIAGMLGVKDGLTFFKYTISNDMVNFFFVISGFIVTLLLLKERKVKPVNLKIFYINRILRICPLYFFIFLAVFFIINYTSLYGSFLHDTIRLNAYSCIVFFLFLINFNSYYWNYNVSVLPHYWSLSIEEQFYLFWPIAVKKFNIFKFSILLIVIWVILRNYFAYLSHHGVNLFWNRLNGVFLSSKFPSMAIGQSELIW